MEPALDPGHPYQRAYAARFKWTHSQIDSAIRCALRELPREHRVSMPAGDLLVVHASPRGLDAALAHHTTPLPRLPLRTVARALRQSPLGIGTRVLSVR